ncbi:heterokaryon incompatibility protein-domain-containing protein [Flammula alnicola]|nr:heterokaryon incompatibility protein-domain-containing protein [Flammula alnicola]
MSSSHRMRAGFEERISRDAGQYYDEEEEFFDSDDDDGSESDAGHLEHDPLHDELNHAVREHVFNKMPIRLLLLPEIKLIERGAVVEHVMRSITGKIDQQHFDSLIAAELAVNQLPRRLENESEAKKDVISDILQEHAGYAILSHTWLQRKPEVVYRDMITPRKWQSIRARRGAGYRKLAKFCEVAAGDHGVSFAWMDTVCINKDSTSELDESIRSMYRWYRDSYVCITYLADTASLDDMPEDRWFTRARLRCLYISTS